MKMDNNMKTVKVNSGRLMDNDYRDVKMTVQGFLGGNCLDNGRPYIEKIEGYSLKIQKMVYQVGGKTVISESKETHDSNNNSFIKGELELRISSDTEDLDEFADEIKNLHRLLH